MNTAIMLAGLLLPILVASVYYVDNSRTARRQTFVGEQPTEPQRIAEQALAQTGLGQPSVEH